MDSPRRPKFAHLANRDKTFDSVCCECFLTVATAECEADLVKGERDHVCDPSTIETYRRAAHKA
jgi:hypothetical protein